MIGGALALLLPASAIALVVLPSPVRQVRAPASAVALVLVLGIGFSSVTATALIASGVAPAGIGFVLADVAIWALVGSAGWMMRRTRRTPAPAAADVFRHDIPGWRSTEWMAGAAFGLIAIAALASWIASTAAAPHGDWDAWAIWNQRARFLFRGGGSDAWRAMVAIEWAQPDYPLLLPASVARVWAYAGQETTTGPALVAIVFGAASVALVMGALGGVRRWMAGAMILGATTFLEQVPSQCADVPLAALMVAAFVVAGGRDGVWSRESFRVRALVTGAACAMAAWAKNEGLVLLAGMLLVAAVAAVRRRAASRLLWGIAGAAPAAIAIVWFKLTLAPSSPLFESLAISLERFVDLDRHHTVALLMGQHLLRWGSPIALGIAPLMGVVAAWVAMRGDTARREMAAIVGLMFASYYLVYVTTPFEIAWHVSTSFDRLIVQLWPSLVLAVFLGARDPRPEFSPLDRHHDPIV